MTMTTFLLITILVVLVANTFIRYTKPKGMGFSQFVNANTKQSMFSNWDFSRERSLAICQTILFVIGLFFVMMCIFTPDDTICFSKNQVIAKRSYWTVKTKNPGSTNTYKERTDSYDIVVDIDGKRYERTYEKSRYDYNSGKLCFDKKTNNFKIYFMMFCMCAVGITAMSFWR